MRSALGWTSQGVAGTLWVLRFSLGILADDLDLFLWCDRIA